MKLSAKDLKDPQSFFNKYVMNDSTVMEFYDYSIHKDEYIRRANELASREFQRTKLVEALTAYNKKFTNSDATFSQINRLLNDRSTVMVGGQQAGILTGPIYTPTKILSILSYAKDFENELKSPVVPIFWLAGEDHDIDEVNHTYFHDGDGIKRIRISERNEFKQPASERKIPREEAKGLIKEAFLDLQETVHTQSLYESLINDLDRELTYVEWCALIIHRLFKDSGIVLMDAADPAIRQIEKPYFTQLVKGNDNLRTAFYDGANQFKKAGFGEPIDIRKENAHLFIHDNGQRFLLEKSGQLFQDKNSGREWSKEEILDSLSDNPLLLSNNVVTRPIMQDMLLPVIGFVAGPGELKYWGTLKNSFHIFNMNMPPVLPRLHLSFISRKVEKNLKWVNLPPDEAMLGELVSLKRQWVKDNKDLSVQKSFKKAYKEMEEVISQLSESMQNLGQDAQKVHQRQGDLIRNQFLQYEKKVEKLSLAKLSDGIRRFEEIEAELLPNGNWQERVLNVFPFLNAYGSDLYIRVLRELSSGDNSKDLIGKHLYVYL
ncbi:MULTISPECIES: bacillithiol biosynthesis cysteine-adding enzyme BshC [Bacillaceae]|uniref:Putative cysteine ligase BshC n=1 Tax=Evansella alkalicola TaxID=745819 RepID=A0ABS6JPF9_9BACI|nr:MULTISPECIES: bacillithiol biosynthesis cysteine-adding enzyme BshC [Bacillaceae]MBU9720452.1 bacillithiol biosynthesis cysteine-adding enzyme BshC [Bacillus alkalicola]